MMRSGYVHGYGAGEAARLADQAQTLEGLLHDGTRFTPGSAVLEAGCGTGAQTLALARNSPGAGFTCVDVSARSLAQARARAEAAGLANVRFTQADIMRLPYPAGTFDHVFVCFVLEHLAGPVAALAALRGVLRPGGTLTVVEGDHGTACFHPESAAAREAIRCQAELQRRAGGDAYIGRRLHPLLREAGFEDVRVETRTVYADGGRPGLADGFTLRTFTAMVAGARDAAIAAGLCGPAAFDEGVGDLRRTAEVGGTFCYTFFKATASAAG